MTTSPSGVEMSPAIPTKQASKSSATSLSSLATSDQRRPGSSRVRRLPKRLRSPSPQPSTSPAHIPQSNLTPDPSLAIAASSQKAESATTLPAAQQQQQQPPKAVSNARKVSVAPVKEKPLKGTTTVEVKMAEDPSTKAAAPTSATEVSTGGSAAEEPSTTATGPGKRKRKPSTMIQPPSTITSPPPPSISTPSQSSMPSLKVKLNPSTASASLAEAAAPVTSSKSKIKIRHSTGSSLKKTTLPAISLQQQIKARAAGGYESDGGHGPIHADHSDLEGDFDSLENLEAPPLIFQRDPLTLGKAKTSKKSAKGKGPLGKEAASVAALPPNDARKQNDDYFAAWAFQSHMPHHSRTKSMPAISSVPLNMALATLRRISADLGDMSGAEDSDMEDEDDFHRAMLEDRDFDGLESAPEEVWIKTDLDTPATTPRSPQSNCGAEEQNQETENNISSSSKNEQNGRSGTRKSPLAAKPSDGQDAGVLSADDESKKEDSVQIEASDSVFSGALPAHPSRRQTHAALLTLSLPYDGFKVDSTPEKQANVWNSSRTGYLTPTLERRASKDLQMANEEEAALASRRASPFERDPVESTTPPLSPTRALLGLPRGLASVSGSVNNSPLLSPVRMPAVSRSASPGVGVFEQLPGAVAAITRETSAAPSSASTCDDLPDVSPFPAGQEDDGPSIVSQPLRTIEEAAMEADDTVNAHSPTTDADSPLAELSPNHHIEVHGPFFSLPETMDLDEIDRAYGGKGRMATPVISPMLDHAFAFPASRLVKQLHLEEPLEHTDDEGVVIPRDAARAGNAEEDSPRRSTRSRRDSLKKAVPSPAAKGRRSLVKRVHEDVDEARAAAEESPATSNQGSDAQADSQADVASSKSKRVRKSLATVDENPVVASSEGSDAVEELKVDAPRQTRAKRHSEVAASEKAEPRLSRSASTRATTKAAPAPAIATRQTRGRPSRG